MKVSVLMPIYNTAPQHLREAIESILSQTLRDFEFLILNDSPDNKELAKIVRSYKDKRIVYKENPKNLGISASRNKLLELARGEYLAVFDHDDVSMPMRLEKQAAYLDANPDVGIVGANIDDGRVTNYPSDNISIKRGLMHKCPIAHTVCMIRKSVIIKYESEFSPCEDFMLFVRLIDRTAFHNLPDVLLKYRWHENNATRRLWDKMVEMDMRVRNFAWRQYPFLLNRSGKVWLRVLGIPFIKIKKQTAYLFGLLPFARIK